MLHRWEIEPKLLVAVQYTQRTLSSHGITHSWTKTLVSPTWHSLTMHALDIVARSLPGEFASQSSATHSTSRHASLPGWPRTQHHHGDAGGRPDTPPPVPLHVRRFGLGVVSGVGHGHGGGGRGEHIRAHRVSSAQTTSPFNLTERDCELVKYVSAVIGAH